MSKKKILIVEDDVSILTGLVDLLTQEGFDVYAANDGKKGIDAYQEHRPDLIVLDIMIPEMNGYEVCRQIRTEDKTVAIIMVTAKEKEIDKVVGLEIGADDYLTKPFGVNELLARINAVLRRKESPVTTRKNMEPISFGDVEIDVRQMKGAKGKEEFDVTEREIQLLQFFMAHKEEALDREVILKEIWGLNYVGTTRTLDQHIVKLRQKIETNPSEPSYILTVHGVGYRFSA